MSELHWFPFFAKDWLSSPARMAMTPEQRGAYIDLLCVAWGNGDVQPSLVDDEHMLSALSGLGKRWTKLGPMIRAQFTADGTGLLYNHKLTEVWNEQQTKHDKAVERGKSGGRTRADNRKIKSSLARANGVDGAYQSESEEAVEALTVLLPASAPGGALGVEPPRAPAPKFGMNGHDDGLAARYAERLNELVDLWTAKYPDDAAELERTLRRDMGLPDGPLSRFIAGALRDRMTSNIRALNPAWPPQEQWIAQQRVKAMDSQPQATQEVA